MDDLEGTYAPQSPDLSGYQSFDPQEQFSQPYSPPPNPSNQHPQFFHPNQYPIDQNQQPFDPFAPDQPIPHAYSFPSQQQPMSTMSKANKTKSQFEDDDFVSVKPAQKQGRQSKKQKLEQNVCNTPAPGDMEGVDVKTKFPVARIKRIMQADEDVGKVSQVTPTGVSKALELFIIALTLKSATVAHGKSARKVTASHLKQAVVGDEQMDFLEQIVSKVPDAPTTSRSDIKKREIATEEEESSDEPYVETRARKKGVGTRKRRGKGDDDD